MATNFKINGTLFEDLYVKSDLFVTGGLWMFGDNTYGKLGDNTTTDVSSPIQTIAAGTNWKQVSCGQFHTSAIKMDGTLWSWGINVSPYNSLGDSTSTTRSSPVQTAAAGTNWRLVACGGYHTAAIKTDGTLWLWGYNYYGQLGDNTVTKRASPVQTVDAGTNWKFVSGGSSHTAAIKTDGTLWTWGGNGYGQLGNNTTTSVSSPIQTVAGGTNWKQVACASGSIYAAFTAAIKTDGTLWTWGRNLEGRLGDNTTTNRSSPVQTIAGGTNWKQVACGGEFSAAIKTDGTLWTWGQNSYGALGDNTRTNRSSPVQTIAGGTNWKQVACGVLVASAIKTDGTLWMWGRNNNGPLGDNTTTDRSSPVQTVAGGTNWKQTSVGGSTSAQNAHTAAIKYTA